MENNGGPTRRPAAVHPDRPHAPSISHRIEAIMATKNSMSQVTRKPSQPATEGIPGKRFRPFRRTRKVIGAIALTALGITLASTTANAVLEQQERSSTAQYGHLVEVAGGALNVVRAGTKGGQPLVLLSGFSTVAPALDFSPLIFSCGQSAYSRARRCCSWRSCA